MAEARSAMTLAGATRFVYRVLGVLYVLIGAGSILFPSGWLPHAVTDRMLPVRVLDEHLLQEFGTVVLALGVVFLWYSRREALSRSFHWAMTFYFSLDALIHWVGPHGLIGSWSRGIVNSLPFAILLLLGVLDLAASARKERLHVH